VSLLGTHVRYGAAARAFHWTTAILVVAAYVVSPGGSEARVYAPAHDAARLLHETLGMAAFVLAALRLLWRQVDRRPKAPPMPAWMRRASAATHGSLYVLLLATPSAAILGAWWGGHPVTLFAIGGIASPMASIHERGTALAEIHGWLGNAILWLAGLHAVAALFHHCVLRDGVLAAMLPMRRPPPS
jgi:cytochrome b561